MLHCFGILIKGKRKICDRSERDDFNLVGIRFDCFNKIINRALILCCPRRMNQVVIAHTVLAVDTECFSLFPGVCFAHSLINRRVTSGDFKRHQRVIDRLLKIKHDCGRDITNQTSARYGMTKKLVDSYLMKDGTRFTDKPGWNVLPFAEEVADRDPRLAQTIRTPGYSWKKPGTSKDGPEFAYCQTGYQTIKYIQSYDLKPYSTDNSDNDMPVFRYAEVLLNYAEAKAELGTLTQDDIDKTIKLLRDRVGMPNLDMAAANAHPDPYLLSPETGYPNVTGENVGVILEIRRERAIELFQEGYGRYFDLMRWKAGYCLNQPMYGMYIPGPNAYDFGDDSKYTFYLGESSASGTRYMIFDPANPDLPSKDEIFYLVDPNTGNLATAGVRDALHSVSHSFDESKHYFYPIPENDLLLNTNLVQNPNWKK